MSLTGCSFHSTALTTQQVEMRRKIFITLAALTSIAAVALAIIGTVGLLHAHGLIHQFPPSLQWIASVDVIGHSALLGSAGVLMLLGFFSGTYCRRLHVQENVDARLPPTSAQGSIQAVAKPAPQVVTPAILELIGSKKPLLVTIDPTPRRHVPPSANYPFPTTEFELTVSNSSGIFTYTLPCAGFLNDPNGSSCPVGIFIVDGKECRILINREENKQPLAEPQSISPQATLLNAQMQLNGYFSRVKAEELAEYTKKGRAAQIFLTEATSETLTFKVPDLESACCNKSSCAIEIQRKKTQDSLMPGEQKKYFQTYINNNHNFELGFLYSQFECPFWTYRLLPPSCEVKAEGDIVTVKLT